MEILSILAVAGRPMIEAEISEILAVAISTNPGLVAPRDMEPIQDLATTIEKNLFELVVIHDNGTILFIHLSEGISSVGMEAISAGESRKGRSGYRKDLPESHSTLECS